MQWKMQQDFSSHILERDKMNYKNNYFISKNDVLKDINAIFFSIRLHNIRRYIHQRFWTEETKDAIYADRIESKPKLETVSEHSWHVADMALLLAPHFSFLNLSKCLQLAILHDKMEIYAGDPSPVGRDGTGNNAHAFNQALKKIKDEKEYLAISQYKNLLRKDIQGMQESLLIEVLECNSLEARFIKAIDKLQATIYILVKKGGDIEDKHLCFLEKFNDKNVNYFPPLKQHYDAVKELLYEKVAKYRNVSHKKLQKYIEDKCQIKNLFTIYEYENNEYNYFKKKIYESKKKSRLVTFFQELDNLPPANNSLIAYKQISETLNIIEDRAFGVDYWNPLRFYPPGIKTDRMYPVAPESMYPVNNYSKVTLLVSINELIFISNDGAIEFQIKNKNDIFGTEEDFSKRKNKVLYKKNDIFGCGVWDPKNR